MTETPADSTALIDDEKVRVKRCRYGYFLYNPNDAYVGRSLDLYGEFSEGEVDFFRRLMQPGMVAIDVGANIGAHSVALARIVGPSGSVLALEPQRQVFQILTANAALNGLANIHVMHTAAGAKAGSVVVPHVDYDRAGNFGGIAVSEDPETQGDRVPLIALDGLNLPACHLLKIDVEGAEADVIDGAAKLIQTFEPVIYAENDRPEKSQALLSRLLKLGYRLYWHPPALFNPNNYFGNPENVFGGTASLNVIGLPKTIRSSVTGLKEITSADDWPWNLQTDGSGGS